MKNVSVEEFEIHLDLLLSTVPDVKKNTLYQGELGISTISLLKLSVKGLGYLLRP